MTRIVDLSLPLAPGMIHKWYRNGEPFTIRPCTTHDQHGAYGSVVNLYLHIGTHVDAPYHFFKDGHRVDDIPLERFVGPALVLDLRSKVGEMPIEAEDLESALSLVEKKGLSLDPGDRLLLCTGHHERAWGSMAFWDESPYLTPKSAQWIVGRRVTAVGYDFDQETPPHLCPPDVKSPIHNTLLGNGVLNIEYLVGLDRIVNQKVYLVAVPLSIARAEASPARVIAFLDEHPSGGEKTVR